MIHGLLELLQNLELLNDARQESLRGALAQGKTLDEALLGAIPAETYLPLLAPHFGLPLEDLSSYQPTPDLLAAFPARLLIKHRLLPVRATPQGIQIATCRLFDLAGLDELRTASGRALLPVLAPAAEIERCLKEALGIGADTLESMGTSAPEEALSDDLDLTQAAEHTSIIRFVNQILIEALELRATDVHVEPFENELRVRYRVDGLLREASVPEGLRKFHPAIISRIKILSQLDIAEKRLPQDGRIRVRLEGREIDLRVSVIPMIHGEAVVMRILERGGSRQDLHGLGMAPEDMAAFNRVLQMPHGIVLVTGPTGSGKTTTLYTALSSINSVDTKIITIEDPVEYQLRGINQIQVAAKSGLTFATGLRSILRHDPDVVLVGEIRDRETAEIAVQASLTGHLVFSTLHTNDAPGATTRLIDMGVEPYLVSSSLELVIAQRLVRVICKECREELSREAWHKAREILGPALPPTLYCGRGCRACQGTGYWGRRGIFELMPMSEGLRDLILQRTSSGQVRRLAVAEGMRSLRQDGLRLLELGVTTADEVARTTKEE